MKPNLKFFRELRVSDPVLTPETSVSTYTFVTRDGASHSIELRYKFDVPLYEKNSWQMRNHARLHHSIASLNYGLFCDRVELPPLTADDLEYYRAMQRVTAREIYLTRFALPEPHALIKPEYHVPLDEFEPAAVDDLAAIVCELDATPILGSLSPDPARYAVLSSGGKESLLTYGLLRELGEDVTPVYVNESGRHWHTALLSYRYHTKTEPRTQRIWTTVDRLYVAANKLLPCVRPDWQRLEADVYPIQLFTFNSYQMGVAGLCLHEGIGTMLMGNEYDEGPWPEAKGVRYWYGIYDQSQEFDLVLNAFFKKKGWGLTQTSLVRSLTSLTIEDILATRYPDLLETQTSCHATHMENEAPAPCGRCSKCLGILIFLVAGGHDPARLRYAKKDVGALGKRVASTILKVEQAELEHALFLAVQRGWKFEGSANGYVPREDKRVQSIRFHPENSRPDAMPERLAERVYAIFRTRTTN